MCFGGMNADKIEAIGWKLRFLRSTVIVEGRQGFGGSVRIWLALRSAEPPQLPVILLMVNELLNHLNKGEFSLRPFTKHTGLGRSSWILG